MNTKSILITSFSQGKDEVRVTRSNFAGKRLVDIRVFYEDSEGNMKPTKKGISIQVSKFPELMQALQKTETFLGEECNGTK